MEAVVRKRVTRVGSGAWSVYLPKKWVDAWTDKQRQERDLDLRHIGHSILISPVHQERLFEAAVADDATVATTVLLSAYVRGHNEVRLRAVGGAFGNDAVAAARDFLRHLDERLVADCRPDRIAFTLRSDLPPPALSGHDILAVLGAKVQEVLRLARDAMDSHGHDPQRTVHALRLLRDTQHEDVDRLFHQTSRLVATLEIPLGSVTEYQLLGIVAAELQRIGEQGLRIAETMLRDLGLDMSDLAYPREYLAARATLPAPPTGVAREILAACRTAFERLDELLAETLGAIPGGDVHALAALARRAQHARDELQSQVLAAVAEHWGSRTALPDAMAAFTVSKHATTLQATMDRVGSICRHATALLAARPGGSG